MLLYVLNHGYYSLLKHVLSLTLPVPSIHIIPKREKILFSLFLWSFSPFSTIWRTGMTTEITDLAKEVYGVLSSQTPRPACQTPEQQKKKNKPQFFINSSNKKAKSVTLLIQGLDGAVCTIKLLHMHCVDLTWVVNSFSHIYADYRVKSHVALFWQDQRGVCEEALLRVKGVISFTFQMALKRCTVRIRADLPTEVHNISLSVRGEATNKSRFVFMKY